MRAIHIRRHWGNLRDLLRDLHDFCVAPYRVRVTWS